MKILFSRVVAAKGERAVGRVEARVHMLVQPSPSSRPKGQSLLVSVPALDKARGTSLRERVQREAELMAHLMHHTEERLQRAVA